MDPWKYSSFHAYFCRALEVMRVIKFPTSQCQNILSNCQNNFNFSSHPIFCSAISSSSNKKNALWGDWSRPAWLNTDNLLKSFVSKEWRFIFKRSLCDYKILPQSVLKRQILPSVRLLKGQCLFFCMIPNDLWILFDCGTKPKMKKSKTAGSEKNICSSILSL